MIAYVTSIGEVTTDLCKWSLERNGFEVQVLSSGSTLAQKLKQIYDLTNDDFVRIDADVIVNKDFTPELMESYNDTNIWWLQFMTYDWWKQDTAHGGACFIRKDAIPTLRKLISDALDKERPESYMYRLEEFHNPRRCIGVNKIVGLHGYGQKDAERVKRVKAGRNQMSNYDFELAERLNLL